MAKVVIYTTKTCAYCNAAKRFFESKGVAYDEVDVSSLPEKRLWLAEVTGQRTVPQIFIDGRPLGGYSDVVALDEKGDLEPLLGR